MSESAVRAIRSAHASFLKKRSQITHHITSPPGVPGTSSDDNFGIWQQNRTLGNHSDTMSLRFLIVLLLLSANAPRVSGSTVVRSKHSVTAAFVHPLAETRSTPPGALPPGATYQQTMNFPLLGQQTFQISVLSETTAHLKISGMMSIDEIIPFTLDNTGRLFMSLPNSVLETLQRFRTKFLEAGYDARTDRPFVRVAPPVLQPLKIMMTRLSE